MIGIGSSNGNGGFTASSNLSPLAPPFTVDRPTSRSALNINATPYATPCPPAHTNWGKSLAPDCQPTPASENVSSTHFPNSTVYLGSPQAEAQFNHVAYSSSSLPDSISYSQFPSSFMNNDFRDGNYYALPSNSVMAQNELGYKSSSTLLTGGNSQDNYTQSLYGLQYPSQWDFSWDGRLDVESGGKNSFPDRIAPGAPNSTNAYSNYFEEDSDLPKVPGKPSGESRVPQISKVTNVQNQVGSLGSNAVVDKPFPEFNAKAIYVSTVSTIPSRTSGISFAGAATPNISKTDSWGHLIPPTATNGVVDKPFPEFNAKEIYVSTVSTIPSRTCGISFTATPNVSIMDSWGHLIPPTAKNGAVHKQHFSNDSPSAPTSFNGVTTGHPSFVTSSTFSGSLPPQINVMHSGNDLSGKSDDIVYDRLYNVRDPWVCQRSKEGHKIKKYMDVSASSIDLPRYDSSAMLFPTKYGEPSGIKCVTSGPLDVVKHKEVADMHGNIHNLEGFSLLIDESDQYPSEDSPCWKGSSSYFSQFQVSESIPSHHHLKSLNSNDGLNLNEPQTFSLSCKIPTSVFSTDFHEKATHSTDGCLGEAGALLSSTERGCIGNHLYDEPKSDVIHSVNNLGATEQNSGSGFCFPIDDHKSFEADAVEMESFRVKKPISSNPIRLCLETICSGSDKEKGSACMANTDVNLNEAPEECHSYVPSNAAKQVLSSLSSDADISSEHNQEKWDEYATESLLKTIVNLSDSLLFYYLNDETPVGNDDYKTLELVLRKLTMCLKFTQEKSSTKECSILKQGPSSVSNGVQACHYAMTNKPLVTKAKYHEDGAILGSNFEGPHKPVRADGIGAGSMTKAIKDILDANFHEDTESHSLATMYKNLWLEAEAVLCTTNYKARYHRMKIEMEKSGSLGDKEKSLECKASPTHVEVIQESSGVGKSVRDVMERYNILNCRVEDCNKRIGSELDSSKFSSDQRTVHKLSTQVTGFTTTETIMKDANTGCQPHDGLATNVSGNPSATSLTNTYLADMAEDRVMSRLQVQKSRGDYSKYTVPEQQPSELTMDSVRKRDCSPVHDGELLDGRFKPIFETGITKATVAPSEDGFEGECAFVSQPNCQKFAHDSEMVKLGVQFSGGWYENTSSEWEHVLKDELTWTGGAVNP